MATSLQSRGPDGVITLRTPSRYSYLRTIRQSVTELCVRCGLSEFKTAQLEMAVDESCSNVIEHSYGGEAVANEAADHPGLQVNLSSARDRIVVEIIDQGAGFDFDSQTLVAPDAYLDEARERGLGMYIIRRFVDEVAYERGTPAGNCLRLTKLL